MKGIKDGFLYRKLVIFVLSSSLTCSGLYAYNLRQLSSCEGLSNSAILSVCQDSEGFMWIGSVDGLNVYNGVDINIFKPTFHKPSLSGNLIEEVYAGESGIIWINTNHGLNRYNKKTDEIESYYEFKGKYYLAKSSANDFFVIHKDSAVSYYDKRNKQFIDLPYPDISINDIQRVFIDAANVLWVITNRGIIHTAAISFASPVPILIPTDIFVHDCNIRYAFMEDQSIYFIDESCFLFEMEAVSRKKNLIVNLKKELTEQGIVSSIIKDNDDYLIAFQTNGLIRLQNTPESEIKYHVKRIDIYCGIFCLYKDKKQDIIWIGTDGQGIYTYTRDLFSISSVTFDRLHSSIQKPIRALFLDKEQTLWIGTKDDGILQIEDYNIEDDIHKKKIIHFTTFNSSLTNNSIYAFGNSHRNILWIGGDGPGLNYYSYKDKKIKKLSYLHPDMEPVLYIHTICEVNDSTLWLTSVGAGIYKVVVSGSHDEPVVQSIKRYTFSKDEMSYNYFFSACQENDSIIWFGNRGYGLTRLNLNTETFENVKFPDTKVRTINDILSVYKDSRGNIWAGSSFGVLKVLGYNPETQEVSFINYNEIGGLPNNTIHGILEDDMGYLWLSTNGGLVRFDTASENFRVFNHESGLNVFEFSDGAYLKDENTGTLFFGGINGFSTITPDVYTKKEFIPQIYFTGFKIYETNYTLHDFMHTENEESYLQLTYDQNFFSVSFIALDYINGQNCTYMYNLENFNTKWIENGHSNMVTFTNIPPGEYILHVKGDNGIIRTEDYPLRIVILPPWYMTVLAYMAYVLLCCLVVCFSVLWIRRRYKQKREHIIDKMYQQQKEEIYESKLRFFTNITHEFSTPLTLIYGPCERILSYEKSDGFIRKYTGIIRKNAEHLNLLIQELIEFRRMETGNKTALIERLHITGLSVEIAETFAELAESHAIRYMFDIEQDFFWNSDKSGFTKILTNLLSNAFKYTPDGGQIILSVRLKDNKLNLLVSNTGKGIKEKDIPLIFDRYRVLEDFERQTQKGFFSRNGLGLAICHNIVKLLGGEINVRSIPNEYTEFEIVLPDRELSDIGIKQNAAGEQNLLPAEPLLKDQLKLQKLDKHKLTIFVIDDDPEIRWYISDMLSEQYNVVSIENPLTVSKMLETAQPHLIVSDIMMPEMDGIMLMKQIKADNRTAHIPFILLSARNTPEEQTEGIRAGAEAYVVKPFNNKYFQSVIERLLQRQDVLKDYYRSAVSAYEFTDGKFIHKENKDFFEKVLLTIDRNLTNPDFSTERLATDLGLSARHLYRKLSGITEQTPASLIREYRLLYVEKLLLTTKHSVDEIMYKAGFNNRGSFYKLFLQKFGVTPKNYREMKIKNGIK